MERRYPGVQPELFDRPWDARQHARRADKETSHAAARSVAHRSRSLMMAIHRDLVARGPATFSQVAARLGLAEGQVWKRLSDLEREGQIEATGETRPGPSGRRQTVWRAR